MPRLFCFAWIIFVGAALLPLSSGKDCGGLFEGEYSLLDLQDYSAQFVGIGGNGLQAEQLAVQIGSQSTWEWALGSDLTVPELSQRANFTFQNQQTLYWKFEISSDGVGTLSVYEASSDRVGDSGRLLQLSSEPMSAASALEFHVHASSGQFGIRTDANVLQNVEEGESIHVKIEAVEVNGGVQILNRELLAVNDEGEGGELSWYFANQDMRGGFALYGNLQFGWDENLRGGSAAPDLGPSLAFSVKSGTLSNVCDEESEGNPTDQCKEVCDHLAYCYLEFDSVICECPEGTVGDGTVCSTTSYSVRTVISCANDEAFLQALWPGLRRTYADLLVGFESDLYSGLMLSSTFSLQYDSSTFSTAVTLNALFVDKESAEQADMDAVNVELEQRIGFNNPLASCQILVEPVIIAYVAGTTEDTLGQIPSGLEVSSVDYDPSCVNGCWVIDVAYSTGKDNSVNSLFLPRVEIEEGSEEGSQRYTQAFEDSFSPINYPCNIDDYLPVPNSPTPPSVTLCCLPEMLSQYRFHDGFNNWASSIMSESLSSCPNEPPMSDVLYEAEASGAKTAILGQFEGMPSSSVTPLGVLNGAANSFAARLTIDEMELGQKAAKVDGLLGLQFTVETFVGLAQFVPVRGLTFADMFATHTKLTLSRNDFFSVSIYGKNDYTYVDNINVRLHQVYNYALLDPITYVALQFTLPAKYRGNEFKDIIPQDSIVVGTGGKKRETAFRHACEGSDLVYTPEMQAKFAQRMQQDCAPDTVMCQVPDEVRVEDEMVKINVPLPGNLNIGYAQSQRHSVYLDLVVNTVDNEQPEGKSEQQKTTINTQLPITAAGIVQWCARLREQKDLSYLVSVDLVIGSAGLESELNRLRKFENVTRAIEGDVRPTRIDTDSIESGLMTMVVKGNEDYFTAAQGRAFSLELEDVITIHIMETGNDTYTEVLGAIEAGAAFEVNFDRSTKRNSLEPTAGLSEICAFILRREEDALSDPCILRRDVGNRKFPTISGSAPTAFELPAFSASEQADLEPSSEFMQTILGESDYAHALGANYSRLLTERYQLNGRYRRGFWINPGYEWISLAWNGEGETATAKRFTISQTLIMVALIAFEEHFDDIPARRRLLMAHSAHPLRRAEDGNVGGIGELDDYEGGVKASTLEFSVNPSQIIADIFAVPVEQVGVWFVVLELQEDVICLERSRLRSHLEQQLAAELKDKASPFLAVKVNSIKYQWADVVCPETNVTLPARRSAIHVSPFGSTTTQGSRQAALRGAVVAPMVQVEMIVVFEEPEPEINTDLLRSTTTNVLAVRPAAVPAAIRDDPDLFTTTTAVDELLEGPNIAIIIGCCIGVVACLVLTAASGWRAYRRRYYSDEEVPTVETVKDNGSEAEMGSNACLIGGEGSASRQASSGGENYSKEQKTKCSKIDVIVEDADDDGAGEGKVFEKKKHRRNKTKTVDLSKSKLRKPDAVVTPGEEESATGVVHEAEVLSVMEVRRNGAEDRRETASVARSAISAKTALTSKTTTSTRPKPFEPEVVQWDSPVTSTRWKPKRMEEEEDAEASGPADSVTWPVADPPHIGALFGSAPLESVQNLIIDVFGGSKKQLAPPPPPAGPPMPSRANLDAVLPTNPAQAAGADGSQRGWDMDERSIGGARSVAGGSIAGTCRTAVEPSVCGTEETARTERTRRGQSPTRRSRKDKSKKGERREGRGKLREGRERRERSGESHPGEQPGEQARTRNTSNEGSKAEEGIATQPGKKQFVFVHIDPEHVERISDLDLMRALENRNLGLAAGAPEWLMSGLQPVREKVDWLLKIKVPANVKTGQKVQFTVDGEKIKAVYSGGGGNPKESFCIFALLRPGPSS